MDIHVLENPPETGCRHPVFEPFNRSSVAYMRTDKAYADACARYLELVSTVRKLADKYGLPFEVAWHETAVGRLV